MVLMLWQQYDLINPRRMRSEAYCSCRVCVSVCLSVCLLFDNSLHEWLFASKTNTHIQRRMEVKKYVGFSLKLLRSRVMAWNTSEKANIQISMYISQAVIAGIEYRARTNRYVKAEQWVSDGFLARFAPCGCCLIWRLSL